MLDRKDKNFNIFNVQGSEYLDMQTLHTFNNSWDHIVFR